MSIYREVLLTHFKHPHRSVVLTDATHQSQTRNQSCGDAVVVTLKIEDDIIVDVGIVAEGCVFTVATSSVLADVLVGTTANDVLTLEEPDLWKLLGTAPTFARASCVRLPLAAVCDAVRSR